MISQIVGGVIPLVYFICPNKSKLRLGKTKMDFRMLGKAASNGSSEFMTNVSMSLVNMLYNWQLMRLIGAQGVAVFGIIMYVSFIFAAIFIGYSMGSAPVIGFHYGAGNKEELKGLFRKSLWILLVFSVVLTGLAMMLAKPLAMIFVAYDAELLELTKRALTIYSLAFLMIGFNIFASSFFTALNDGLTSALISFGRTLVFQVASVLLLPLIFDVDGIWAAVILAEGLALILSAVCVIRNRKKYGYA